jgi:hypothetical protein
VTLAALESERDELILGLLELRARSAEPGSPRKAA